MERFFKKLRPHDSSDNPGSSTSSSTSSNSINSAWRSPSACLDLMNEKQHIETLVIKKTNQEAIDYRTLLTATLDCTRWLLKQGLAFHDHDESETSSNKGNYLELMQFLSDHVEEVRAVVFEKAKGDLKYISPQIQKEIANACAIEVVNAITKDMDGTFFSLLVDESRDVFIKEQMAVVLRYVNKRGKVIERFVGVEYVSETTSSTLRQAITRLMDKLNLSMENLRGQSYDGASNMRGHLNGLKTIIQQDFPQAYYVHCFEHQLQLALIAVANGNENIATFFTTCNSLVNIIGSSCKRRDALREGQQEVIRRTLEICDLQTERGLNQETNLISPCDACWSSNYDTLTSIMCLFTTVIDVLEWIVEDCNPDNLGEANRLFNEIPTFDFVFHLFFIKLVLGITNDLSKALQRKDQDILNAMRLVRVCKQKLQSMRDDGFDELLESVSTFCRIHEIDVPRMDDLFYKGRVGRQSQQFSNLHHYQVNLFFYVIDQQRAELDNRFNEQNIELLLCMTCLSPAMKFAHFDKVKVLKFATFYPQEFKERELLMLEDQLDIYIADVKTSFELSSLTTIGELAENLVSTGRSRVYQYVYLLITLALVLPVATASVERAFSTMNVVKTPLHNKMGNQWLNDNLVLYIERDVFASISNELIMRRFHDMRKYKLPLL